MKKISDEAKEKLVLSFSLKNCIKNLYYKISISDDKNEKFETERILHKNDDGIINFQEKMFYDYRFDKRQKITITTTTSKYYKGSNKEDSYDYERITVFSSLILSPGSIYERNISSNYNSEIISIKIDKDENQSEKIYLFDYLKQGVKLSCYISLDFSKKEKSAMKDIKDINLSILKHIFQVLQVYSKDHYFHPSAFGARMTQQNSIFTKGKLNNSVDELIKNYKNFLEHPKIIPDEKIIFSPLIKKIIDDVNKTYQSNIYNVLFVLLSGNIDKKDYKEIINSMILSSYLPLSIIVIGIGNHDFSKYKELFNLDNKNSSENMPKNKDNIIFISLKSKSEVNTTVEYCLKELRKHIIEFYQMVKYKEEKGKVQKLKCSENVSILFEKNSKESKMLKDSVINPEENIDVTNPYSTPEGSYTLPGDEEYSQSNISSCNNSNINSSNNNTPGNFSSYKSSKEVQKYVLKDSSMDNPNINTPTGSYNNGKNLEEKKEADQKKEKGITSRTNEYYSTQVSDIKESGFSIFDKK